MNGIDLLVYSHMKQHQEKLLEEAEGLRFARSARRARFAANAATRSPVRRLAVDPKTIGVLRPGGGTLVRSAGRQRNSTLFRRMAARFGTSLVGFGRRLERWDV
ncbi:MAG TPA: hypothetical protein VKZ43_03585 [Trueperaceae bacterium]|nr:hypothetical protein [Trueperaceae bacterium]